MYSPSGNPAARTASVTRITPDGVFTSSKNFLRGGMNVDVIGNQLTRDLGDGHCRANCAGLAVTESRMALKVWVDA